MSILTAIPIIGDFFKGLFNTIDEVVEDKDKANELKANLENVMSNADLTKFTEQIRAQKDIIIAEAQSESWLARNWRPGIMALFGVIIANNYIIQPYASALFGVNVMLPIPDQMWDLLKLGLSGYVVGRSAEKCIKYWKDKEEK